MRSCARRASASRRPRRGSPTPTQRIAEAERRAAESGDADESLKRTLVLAQRTADAAIKEARDEATAMLASAEQRAAEMLAEAEEATSRARSQAEEEARRAHEDARARVLAELHDLESARDQLRHDVDVLEAHMAEQRDRLRMTTRELQRLLDDPAALREVAVPAISDIDVPAFLEPAPSGGAGDDVEPDDDGPADWMPDDAAWSDDDDLTPPAARRRTPTATRPVPSTTNRTAPRPSTCSPSATPTTTPTSPSCARR